MCGIVGTAGLIYAKEKKVFRNLLDLDVMRGRDATGVAIVDRDNKVKVRKSVGMPGVLYYREEKDFEDDGVVTQVTPKLLLGHNRWATRGKKIDANAHPFEHDHIVGVHNGTLDSLWRLEDSKNYDVDSDLLYHNIAVAGFEKTMKNLSGAWALVWFDKKTTELNVIRNAQRPLYWSWNSDGSTVFWASEPWMLKIAASREGVSITEPESFKENLHYTLNLEGIADLKDRSFLYEETPYPGFTQPIHRMSSTTSTGGMGSSNPFREEQRKEKETSGSTNRPPTISEAALAIADKKARDLIGKRVEFLIAGEHHSRNSLTYLLADSVSIPQEYEIRIYNVHHPKYKEWKESTTLFNAKVKGVTNGFNQVTNKTERYVILDVRTMSDEYVMPKTRVELNQIDNPVDHKPKIVVDNTAADKIKEALKTTSPTQSTLILGGLQWDVNKTYTGYHRQALSFGEFMKNTKNGCMECGVDISPYECDTIVWVGPKQYICSLCDARHRDEETLEHIRQTKAAYS